MEKNFYPKSNFRAFNKWWITQLDIPESSIQFIYVFNQLQVISLGLKQKI